MLINKYMVYVDHQCHECGKKIKGKGKYCARPEYCRVLALHKKRNPKITTILNNKDDNFYYLLGLISADGHLHKNDYGIEITFNNKDRHTLEQIFKKYGGSIRDKKDNTVIWCVSYKPFYDYLLNIGITPAKSNTLNVVKFFQHLNRDEKIAFIRGVLDGDGGVRVYEYQNKNKYSRKIYSYLSFDICSNSKIFIETIAEFLNSELNEQLLNVTYEPKARAYYIKSYARFKPIRILDLIYSTLANNICIHRKYNMYMTYKQTHGDHVNVVPSRLKTLNLPAKNK